MHDSLKELKEKIGKGYCPEGIVEGNPILEYFRYIIFRNIKSLKIERPSKFGGDIEFGSYAELEKLFVNKKIHPMDLKNSCAVELDKLIKPTREYFEKNKKAAELYSVVKNLKITR